MNNFKFCIYRVEAALIRKALVNANGSVSKAAESLGLHHWQFVLVLKRHPDLAHLEHGERPAL